MACSAAFVVLLTVFPTDYGDHAHSSIGRLHNCAAVSAFIAATAAMTCSSLPLRRPVAWSNVAMVAFPVAMLVFAVCLTFDIGPRGLVQRTSAACQLAWLVALAMRPDRGLTARSLRRGAAAPSS